jgi:radical SAM protein with 4Fe4S-binding SPASM domain
MVYGNERGLSWQSRCGLVNNGGGVGVDVDGTIYACHRFVTERKDTDAIGSIQNGIDWSKVDAIRAEWNSVKPHAVNPERCNTCPIRATCIGGCIAVNKDTTKDLHTLPKSDCDLKLAILKGLYKAVLLKRSIEMETANARQMNACNAKK